MRLKENIWCLETNSFITQYCTRVMIKLHYILILSFSPRIRYYYFKYELIVTL